MIHEIEPVAEQLKPAEGPVCLVTAVSPGCGATTIAGMLEQELYNRFAVSAPVIRLRGHDAGILKKLPDCPVIIEGDRAIETGLTVLGGVRDIIGIELRVSPVVATVRKLRKDGWGMASIVNSPEVFLQKFREIQKRVAGTQAYDAAHVQQDRYIHRVYDTTWMRPEEIVGDILGISDWTDRIPAWEQASLLGFVARIRDVLSTNHLDERDKRYFEENLSALERLLNGSEITVTRNEKGITLLRGEIRRHVMQTVFSALIRKIPRFYEDIPTHEIIIDTSSALWSPEYYKIGAARSTLDAYLRGKIILDPFGGSGALVNVLSAMDIVKDVYMGDLAYPGGHNLDRTQYRYRPDLNAQMLQAFFDELPSWYKPKLLKHVDHHITLDATALPFADASVDLVVADPPYGKNLADGGLGLFHAALPEMLRVSKEGVIVLIPKSWEADIPCGDGYVCTPLTGDLSCGQSKLPTYLLIIEKR